MEVILNEWKINLVVDDDGMLEVCLSNSDESPVVATDTDKWDDDKEWGERFTTKKIENEHRDSERKRRHRGQHHRHSLGRHNLG